MGCVEAGKRLPGMMIAKRIGILLLIMSLAAGFTSTKPVTTEPVSQADVFSI